MCNRRGCSSTNNSVSKSSAHQKSKYWVSTPKSAKNIFKKKIRFTLMHLPSRKYLQICLPLCSTVCWLMNSWLIFTHFFTGLPSCKKKKIHILSAPFWSTGDADIGDKDWNCRYLMEAIRSFIATSAPPAIFALQFLLHSTSSSNIVVVPSLGNAWKTGITS